MTIHSPWFKLDTNTSLFILYFTKPGYKLEVFIEEDITRNSIQVDYNELHRVNYTERIQRVLIKVPLGVPHNGTIKQRITINEDKHVFIGNIWEQTNLDITNERGPVTCDKSNITDIYNTVERTNITNTENESFCSNGGRLENGICVCPPGYAGNQCQRPCGRNQFGENCSFVCSQSNNECKGMILCTPYYGCTCAPGYYGNNCTLQCEEGFYGADCNQTCNNKCQYDCNKYTGECRDQCSKPHLLLSLRQCTQNISYLRDAPEIVDYNFTSVKLQVNFNSSKIVGSLDRIKFYMVQTREDMSPTWNDGPYEDFKQVLINITVNGLKPGRLYEFRVILIDFSIETDYTQMSQMAKISQASTNCNLSLKQDLYVSSISTGTIGLTWANEIDGDEMECPILGYWLEIDDMKTTEISHPESKRSFEIKGNSYSIENLKPDNAYLITLNKVTIFGKSEPIARKIVTTDSTNTTKLTAYKTTSTMIGLRWNMPNISLTMVHINIELRDLSTKIWNKTINMSITLHSYRCKPWPGFTCFDVSNLVMDTKYNITIQLLSIEKVPQDILTKSIIAETKETSPSPVRDVNLKLISDTSLSLTWRIPLELNGILRKFTIDVEHVSSFVKEMCCEISIIDYTVGAEVEMYSHVLQDIKPASSYKITIRPLGKEVGPEVSQTIDTPPPRIPFQRTVEYSNKLIKLDQTNTHNEDSIVIYNTLISEILVIVQPKFNTNSSLKKLTRFRNEMSELLESNNWWVTHVCAAADVTCTIDLNLETESTDILPYYGRIETKPLQSGKPYRIVLVQVSKYQSARSYTTELYSI
ncbi:hypothetical protein WDU94_012538 [Cyamophila willieti]